MTAVRYLVLLLLLALPGGVSAVSVKGSLSTASASVGETIMLELSTEGGTPDRQPELPSIDGLEVLRRVPYGSRMMIVPGVGFRSTSTYTYTLVPRREGTFTIPPIEVVVDGAKFRTEPLTIKVTPADKTTAGGGFAFGEIRIGRPHAYVGEDVPVELRYHLDVQAARWNWQRSPTLPADGFAGRRILEALQSQVEVDGKKYGRLNFRTVITPSKAGKMTVGPAPMTFVYSKSQRSRYDPFGGFLESAQQLNVTAPAIELEVKPLPVEGRPKDFSGGIGKFQLRTTAKPERVKLGDPVTVTLAISGQGNFDRIGAPMLVQPEGWRTYPPADKFEPGDELQSTGVKTFEFAVVPEAKKEAMPVFTFSYFDPEQARYITLKSDATPLAVEGTPVPVVENAAPTVGDSASKPAAAPEDIHGLLPMPGFAVSRWLGTPARWFLVMFAPLPVLAGVLIWRSRRSDPRAAEVTALRREKAALLNRVRTAADRAEVLEAVARVLQIETALAIRRPPAGIELPEILKTRTLDSATSRAIEELFAARAELVYAGGAQGSDQFGAKERDRVLETLASYERSKAR